MWKFIDPERKAVFDAAQAQLTGTNLPDGLIASLIIVKKTASAVATTGKNYKKWVNMLDYETLGWERIEQELTRGLFNLPRDPYIKGANDSVTLFVNSNKFEPRVGSRQIVATLWVLIHYIITKSENGLEKGVTVATLASGISYSKFYPAIQKCLFDALQSVLPMRVAGIHVVDPPYIFQMVWGIVSGWMSEKLRNRVFVLKSENISKHYDKSSVPSFLKGDKQYPVERPEDWADVKAFYHDEFLPMVTALADAPGTAKVPDLWEPAGKK